MLVGKLDWNRFFPWFSSQFAQGLRSFFMGRLTAADMPMRMQRVSTLKEGQALIEEVPDPEQFAYLLLLGRVRSTKGYLGFRVDFGFRPLVLGFKSLRR